jgi:hypothetical protein
MPGMVVHAYITLELWRLRQEDHEFETSLDYIASSRTTLTVYLRKRKKQKKEKERKRENITHTYVYTHTHTCIQTCIWMCA